MIFPKKLLSSSHGLQLKHENYSWNNPGQSDSGDNQAVARVENHRGELGAEELLHHVRISRMRRIVAGHQSALRWGGVRHAAIAIFTTQAAATLSKRARQLAAAGRRSLEAIMINNDSRAKEGHDQDVIGGDDQRRINTKALCADNRGCEAAKKRRTRRRRGD